MIKYIFAAALIVFISSQSLRAQDTTGVQIKGQQGNGKRLQEQNLGTIHVKAIIEKPSVAIIPMREEPETGEMELIARSFAAEIKEAPNKEFFTKQDIQKADKAILINRRRQ